MCRIRKQGDKRQTRNFFSVQLRETSAVLRVIICCTEKKKRFHGGHRGLFFLFNKMCFPKWFFFIISIGNREEGKYYLRSTKYKRKDEVRGTKYGFGRPPFVLCSLCFSLHFVLRHSFFVLFHSCRVFFSVQLRETSAVLRVIICYKEKKKRFHWGRSGL